MSKNKEERLEEEVIKETKPSLKEDNLKKIIIVTDGANWKLLKVECSPLELKAILRDLLARLGS